FLIIGYGNTLRGDDGAGQRVVEMVAEWGIEEVRSLPLHQLTPELADPISTAKLAIFVDAYPDTNSQGLQVQPLEVEEGSGIGSTTHNCEPRSLLQMANFLYGSAPPAWWLLVPAVNFDFGEELSAVTQQGIAEALSKIKELISEI
ncbi:MAG: hydrogenase maturation protease, partial [Okeania sp. SIO2H7]|nr:hydrogenase maturation protease [Okeania sp. SIO2H7]